MILLKQNEYFYRVKNFLTEVYFLKGDPNIYFEYKTLFEKKKEIFTEKNRNLENSYIFFSEKNIYFFSSSFATFEQP